MSFVNKKNDFHFQSNFFISLSLYRTTQNINNCRNEVRMMHDATMQGSPRKKFNKIRELNRRRNYFTKKVRNALRVGWRKRSGIADAVSR